MKLFMFGPAGCGKTTASIQFPNAYIIDAERGSDNYEKIISAANSVVFHSSDANEVVQEVKSLVCERHDYRTLVIDPITTIYNDLLDKCEEKVGSDHGRHYGAAGKVMKRLANLINALDMNVVITAHAKTEYGANLSKLGYTFDGWKQLDYWFDLVIELGKKGKKRFAKVIKTRLDAFPDEDVFEWSYESVKRRYDASLLEKPAAPVDLATPEQVREIKDLLSLVRLPEGAIDNWFAKAGVDVWEDMPRDILGKCIEYVKTRMPGASRVDTNPLTDADRWRAALDAAFRQRDFDVPEADAAIDGILRGYKVANILLVPLGSRQTILDAIRDGKADKYRANGQPAEPAVA